MQTARIDHLPPTRTAQQKGLYINRRTGRAKFYTKACIKSVEKLYATLLHNQRPDQPLQGPVHLCIRYVFPFRSKEAQYIRAQGFRLHDVRPDLDNLEKLLIDTLTKCKFWKDDAQISIKLTAKLWGLTPGIDIRYAPANAHWLNQHF